jgi:AbrB family looped-hinge helix DNA binding protein
MRVKKILAYLPNIVYNIVVGKVIFIPTFQGGFIMPNVNNYFVDNAKVMAKGQITLPKYIRTLLKVGTGDRVTLVCEGDRVVMMNAAVYAMKMLQKDMTGEAEKAGLRSDEDVIDMIMEMRAEEQE